MLSILIRVVINACAIWFTTLVVPGVRFAPFDDGTAAELASWGIVAVVFALVNGVIGSVLKVLAFPIYILTFGLIAFIINGLLLVITAQVTEWFGFGLTVDGFWWAVLGAIVISIVNALLGAVFRPRRRD